MASVDPGITVLRCFHNDLNLHFAGTKGDQLLLLTPSMKIASTQSSVILNTTAMNDGSVIRISMKRFAKYVSETTVRIKNKGSTDLSTAISWRQDFGIVQLRQNLHRGARNIPRQPGYENIMPETIHPTYSVVIHKEEKWSQNHQHATYLCQCSLAWSTLTWHIGRHTKNACRHPGVIPCMKKNNKRQNRDQESSKLRNGSLNHGN